MSEVNDAPMTEREKLMAELARAAQFIDRFLWDTPEEQEIRAKVQRLRWFSKFGWTRADGGTVGPAQNYVEFVYRTRENAALLRWTPSPDVVEERDMAEAYYKTLEAHLREHGCEHDFAAIAEGDAFIQAIEALDE